MNYFITGIGTNVGKTVVSAILTEALQADYWKPIQSGTNEGRDSDVVHSLISNPKTKIHPETYLLEEPLSPHFAAKLEGVTIDLDKLKLPETENHIIIEGAGGILVPINQSHYVIDIAKKLDCELIVIISNYLGCINHSLLSIDYLMKNNYKIKAIVFNGEFDEEVRRAIVDYTPDCKIIQIPTMKDISKQSIKLLSSKIAL